MDERAPRPKIELVKSPKGETRNATVSSIVATPPPTADPANGMSTGAVVDGKYLVGPLIGSGACGLVFEAKNLELDEKVALKTLRPEIAIDPAMVARFAREAKAAAAIKSEYVATIYDVGTTPDGLPYIVMEFLEGKDLGTIVEESGPFGARSAVEHALQICEALAVAHARGIVHRDIKPENLLLTERAGGMRIVKVIDFGISKSALTGSVFGAELPIVKTINLMGTPLYMSPEQVRCSDRVDVRSDVWSLGMVLYEILAGTTAFEGNSITEICAAILEAAPTPIELHRSDLPAGLVGIIGRCLEKSARHRFQNVGELALALMPFGPKRSRLNVERAIAVLQGAGLVDPELRIDSASPPPMTDPPSVDRIPTPALPTFPPLDRSSAASSGITPNSIAPTAASSRVAPPRALEVRHASWSSGPTALISFIIGAAVLGVAAIGAGALRREKNTPPTSLPTISAVVLPIAPTTPADPPSAASKLAQPGAGATTHEESAALTTTPPAALTTTPPTAGTTTPPSTRPDNARLATKPAAAAGWRLSASTPTARPKSSAPQPPATPPPSSAPPTIAPPSQAATGRTFRREL